MGTGLISRSKIRQRNRDKHLKKGLCRHCSKKVKEGRKMCEYHLEYNRNRNCQKL